MMAGILFVLASVFCLGVVVASVLVKDFRRLLFLFLVVVATLWLTACASTPVGGDSPCLPAQMPHLDASWKIMEQRDVTIPDGRMVRVTGYHKAGRDIVVITMDGVLVVVDFAPMNPNVPVWANERYFDPATNQIRPAPIEGPCRWFQPIVGERA